MNKKIMTFAGRVLAVCTLLFAHPFHAPAATNGAVARENTAPKVGLVLSGGGAKGIAHIGVIKALEENGIPIDCVAGTSAGAIVGSLYACGWSPEEILGLFTSESFKYWSSGTVSKADIYYEMLPEPLPLWADVGLNIGKHRYANENIFSQIIPSNLISPIPMNLEFLKLYVPYTAQCGENFDNLFVPLRTVCSDVYHKHKIVCRDGSLGDAVRASMSFPLVFKPIELDSVLVYDGGIYDNFPVDVMHDDFRPDFMVGVSVSGPDGPPEPDNIYSQLEDMIIQNNDYNLPAEWGVKIQVPVLGYGTFAWDDAREIYETGYRTGLAMVDSIKERCSYRRSPEEVAARRERFRNATPLIEFRQVEVEGAHPPQDIYIKHLFTRGKPGEIDMAQVKSGYYRAVTTGKLLDLLPQAKFEAPGVQPDLVLKATVKQPWNVGAGGWITSSVHSQLFVTFGYHTLSLSSLDVDLSAWVGQTYYAGMLSGKISLPTSNPSSIRLFGVISRQKYYDNELMFYQNGTPKFINEAQQYARLEYSMAAGKPAKLYARASYGHIVDEYHPDETLARPELDKTDYNGTAIEIGYEANTLGNGMYPMSGRTLSANIIATFEKVNQTCTQEDKTVASLDLGTHTALSAKAEWRHYFPVHRNFVVGGMAEGLMTFRGLYQSYEATLVHSVAFAPTPSTRNYFNTGFRSDNYLAVGVIPVWSPLQKLQFRGDFYLYTPMRNLVATSTGCRYEGWFKKAEFIGEMAAVYNFKFASLALYCNYLTYPARNWNFGLNLGLLFQAPRFAR